MWQINARLYLMPTEVRLKSGINKDHILSIGYYGH